MAILCMILTCYCRRTLADIIMEKITEKQTEVGTVMSEASGRPMPQLDPRVIEVYKGVNKVTNYVGYIVTSIAGKYLAENSCLTCLNAVLGLV